MKRMKKWICAALLAAGLSGLCGCATTVDQMYCLPRRSERYENLQTLIDQSMSGLEYSAPTAGENQQTVQMADLDGDGNGEVILFAKGSDEDPMKILIFTPVEDAYELLAVIESTGTAFDQVEYVQMDGLPGLEMVVGRQVSDQVLRNVTVYSFSDGEIQNLLTANYRKFLICDLGKDGLSDLFLLHPGLEEGSRGLAELYTMNEGNVERSAEAELSEPVDHLKRIVTGTLQSGESAVFVASTAGEEAVITDVFSLVRGVLTNVSFSNDSGTSVKTLRNYYVYADDIDADGVVELPDLISMRFPEGMEDASGEHLIRWYSMSANGDETDKRYTYHNYLGGWYVELPEAFALRTFVIKGSDGGYQFYLWNEDETETDLVFTLYVLTGEERLTAAEEGSLTQIMKTDSMVCGALIGPAAQKAGVTADDLENSFCLIQMDWNTGEM